MQVCDDCKQELQLGDWPFCPHGRAHATLQPGGYADEKVVVYQSAKEGGHIQWPGRSDVPVPKRLRDRGYEKVHISPRELGAFEKKHGVINERRHWDRNGGGV